MLLIIFFRLLIVFTKIGLVFQQLELGRRISGVREMEGSVVECRKGSGFLIRK